jgi:DNA-binding response OmpR family regulator
MPEQQKTVLMVDDDVDYLEANRVALEARGLRVITATDSRDGVELARTEQPNLIIQDLMMEQLYAGFSVVETLHAHAETRDIPIIMISAVTTETGFRIDKGGEKPEWLKVVDFMHKPVDPMALADKVIAILDQCK